MPIVQVKSTNTLISNVRYKTLQCIRTWRLVLLFAFACCPLACLLAVRSACGSFARAPLSQLNLGGGKSFTVSATKSASLLFLVWERVVSPVENPKLPLIALHGGAAVAAAGINGISVYGVITPTLPMDKRCHWTPVTNCAASSSTTNCSLSMWSRSCPLEYASCRAFQSSILKCRLLYSC